MNMNAIGVFFISLTLLFSGIHTKRPSTCRDLRKEVTSREDEIENLKQIVEEYKLTRDDKQVKYDECNGYNTCSKCLLHRTNPSCGWCNLQNRCSLQENCRGSESNSRLWTTDVERCPKIRSVNPPLIPAGTVRMLKIDVLLPEDDGIYLCSFEVLGKTLLTKGRKMNTTEGGITCATPPSDKIPEIPVDNVYLPVKLSIRIPYYGLNFASITNFTIFECRRHTSCSECTASPFPCTWCLGGNRCTHDAGENCRNDILMTSKANNRPSIREGPGFCPRILPYPDSGSNEILVHSGSSKRIAVKVENLAHFQAMSRIVCQVKSVGQVRGQLLADTIYCDSMTFKVLDLSPVTNLSFSVYWDGGTKQIDNIQNLHVVVYHCGLLASSCSECLELPEDFDCGWCGASNSCSLVEHCGESEWMDKKNKMCPKPKITSFHPKYGLPTQKTNITIKGVDFGRIEDIESIRLLDIPRGVIMECTPWNYLFKGYNNVYGIVCQLDIPENKDVQGVFNVKVVDKLLAVSDEEFSFVDPNITGYAPVKGIKSGGTHLKIEGHNLDAGNKVDVFVGDIPCKNVSRDSTTICCITFPSPRTKSSEVRVIFDGEEKKLSPDFLYVEDPYVRSVKSEKGASAPIGTLSGGNLIFVEGGYFDQVPNPYIFIIIDGAEYPGGCTVESDKRMECVSPRLPTDVLSFCGEEGFMAFDYGFRMGDVKDVQNISANEYFDKFRIYPDPFFMPFTEEGMTKIYKSDPLIIYGKYLDSVFDEQDITVHIGAEKCVVTSLSHTQLTCKPPKAPPREEDADGSDLPAVMVTVREKHEFFIGFLRYSETE